MNGTAMATEREQEAAGPDLAHLPEPLRLRIAVAMTEAAVWERDPFGGWNLYSTPGRASLGRLGSGGSWVSYHLPAYLTDPAAWGALMEREGISVVRYLTAWGAVAAESTYPTHGGIMVRIRTYALHECIGWAVCLAVLAKHGIQWPTAGFAPGASATPP